MSKTAHYEHLNSLSNTDFADKIESGELKLPSEGWNLLFSLIWKVIQGILEHRKSLRNEIKDLKVEIDKIKTQLQQYEKV